MGHHPLCHQKCIGFAVRAQQLFGQGVLQGVRHLEQAHTVESGKHPLVDQHLDQHLRP